jgi:hypothetical protein
MTTTTDTTAQTNDYLIRALYSAKAVLKNAAADCQTAEHNLADSKADRSTSADNLARIVADDEAAYKAYQKAETIYDTCYHVCCKLKLI